MGQDKANSKLQRYWTVPYFNFTLLYWTVLYSIVFYYRSIIALRLFLEDWIEIVDGILNENLLIWSESRRLHFLFSFFTLFTSFTSFLLCLQSCTVRLYDVGGLSSRMPAATATAQAVDQSSMSKLMSQESGNL